MKNPSGKYLLNQKVFDGFSFKKILIKICYLQFLFDFVFLKTQLVVLKNDSTKDFGLKICKSSIFSPTPIYLTGILN